LFAEAVGDGGVRVLLHESFHAVDAAIIDHIYEGDPSFSTLSLENKLTNADSYAHVARVQAGLQEPAPPEIEVLASSDLILTSGDVAKAKAVMSLASHQMTRAWVRGIWDRQFVDRIGLYRPDPNVNEFMLRRLRRMSEGCGLTLHSLGRQVTVELSLGRSTAILPSIRPFPSITAYDRAVLEEVIGDLHSLVGWARQRHTVSVIPRYPAPYGVAYLYGPALQDPTVYQRGLALAIINQAVLSLANPWLSSPLMAALVVALTISASV
jgi:hypothetical protein